MSDKRKIFDNILDVINLAKYSFWGEFGREPNKIILSVDVISFILAYDYDREMLTPYIDPELKQIMGMDVEIIHDKKGFIEVGYFVHNPLTVNVDYERE